jgi:TM2 domain-containing membrane protein YozV
MVTTRLKLTAQLSTLIYLLTINSLFAQNLDNLLSDKNRIAFGNYLFCEHDYLRAIDEFDFVLKTQWDDSLQFKIATSYYRMMQFDRAYIEFKKIQVNSLLFKQSQYEQYRTLFMSNNYVLLQKVIDNSTSKSEIPLELLHLKNSSILLRDIQLPLKNGFISAFGKDDRTKISEFYDWKYDLPYKSPALATIMSAIIPGSGKIYAEEVGDGITAFLLTGLFTYLAVDKFQNNHNSSGWLYSSIAAFFYAGNVYGSATAVQNYNAGIKFNFDREVKIFINDRNQFLPTPKHLCN